MSPEATSQADTPIPVVVLTGPTAAGKSALGIQLARRFDGEIVNADSMQVFRYMDIGTAKPSLEERAIVPHHLFDVVTPDVAYSAGHYAVAGRDAIARIHERGRVAFLVGGTGLYIRALLQGLVDTGVADVALRERLEAEHARAAAEGDPDRLHRRLEKIDPEAAARIHPNDLRRTIRALEIAEQAGLPASEVRAAHGFANRSYRVLHVAIDAGREEGNRRIDLRCQAMIEGGLLQEVRGLRERGYGPELKPMQAIGYRHIQPVVDGSDTLANALEAMKRDTRRFARRQRTWLRKVDDVVWLEPEQGDDLASRVERFLAKDDA